MAPSLFPFHPFPPSLPELCEDGRLEEVRAVLARTKEVRAALARGEDIFEGDGRWEEGLVLAAENNHEAVVELLLQQPGLDVNLGIYEVNNQTALHRACSEGHAGVVRRLLAHPSLTCHNAVDNDGLSPLMWAVFMNHVECVRELVAVEVVDLEPRDLEGKGLEEVARRRVWRREGEKTGEALQVVREEQGRRGERRIFSVEEMMVRCSGVLEKHSKLKKVHLKNVKAGEVREKILKAAEAQKAKIESVHDKVRALKALETTFLRTKEEMTVELKKLEALMGEDSGLDRRDEVE